MVVEDGWTGQRMGAEARASGERVSPRRGQRLGVSGEMDFFDSGSWGCATETMTDGGGG